MRLLLLAWLWCGPGVWLWGSNVWTRLGPSARHPRDRSQGQAGSLASGSQVVEVSQEDEAGHGAQRAEN